MRVDWSTRASWYTNMTMTIAIISRANFRAGKDDTGREDPGQGRPRHGPADRLEPDQGDGEQGDQPPGRLDPRREPDQHGRRDPQERQGRHPVNHGPRDQRARPHGQEEHPRREAEPEAALVELAMAHGREEEDDRDGEEDGAQDDDGSAAVPVGSRTAVRLAAISPAEIAAMPPRLRAHNSQPIASAGDCTAQTSSVATQAAPTRAKKISSSDEVRSPTMRAPHAEAAAG